MIKRKIFPRRKRKYYKTRHLTHCPNLERIDCQNNQFTELTAQQLADFKVAKENLTRDLQNKSKKIVELETSLDETRETWGPPKKVAFLEKNLEQSTNVQKQLVEQNSSLKKEVVIAERKLHARNERIQALEDLLQNAQEKFGTQNKKFEAQLQTVRERLEQARSQKTKAMTSLSFGRIAKPLRSSELEIETQPNQQFQEFSNLLFPNQPYNFDQLKQEITRLKYHELAPQLCNKRTEFEQLIAEVKNKAGNSEKIIDLLLETYQQKEQATETSQKDKLSGKIEAYQNVLEGNLTKEELQTLLNKQIELCQLEKHLASLQINEQVAQIIQPTVLPFKK
ncbi:11795_t:CDS:2 [Entrophospora sp. SA101]|nr:98_t:CDS:2 [Entrophospora sp. SA101]CAJ0830072.1 11795_t:CDS:2 [Entrophospora sp. SA101]CAJ0912295.1 9083_t:CDS:2 [Entrophospora sp. SA101]